MFSHPLRGDGDAGESEVDDGAARLADRRRDVLEREERDGSQTRALGADPRGEVVVGAGVGRRVVGLDDSGHAEAAGREQDRDVDPLAVHVAESGRDVVVFHPAQASAHARVHAVARHERAPPLREGLRQARSESCVPLDDVSVGVDHFWRHDATPAIQALSGPGADIMPQEPPAPCPALRTAASPALLQTPVGHDRLRGQQVAELAQVRQAKDSGDTVVQRAAGRAVLHARQAFEFGCR